MKNVKRKIVLESDVDICDLKYNVPKCTAVPASTIQSLKYNDK